MKYYQFHIGDYAGRTSHLTWDEHAAYRMLIDWYYDDEGPIPSTRREIYRKLSANTKERREAVDAVLGEFFTEDGDVFRHEKCDEKIAEFYAKSAKAAAAGKASGASRRKTAKRTSVQKTRTDVQQVIDISERPLPKPELPITHNPIQERTPLPPLERGGGIVLDEIQKNRRPFHARKRHSIAGGFERIENALAEARRKIEAAGNSDQEREVDVEIIPRLR